jgi:hypothetical protein
MNATSVKSCRSKKAIPQGTGTFSRQSQHIRFISMKNRLVPHQESSRDSRKFPLRVGGRSPQGVFQVSGSNCAQLVAHQTQIFFHRSSPKMVHEKISGNTRQVVCGKKHRNRVSKKMKDHHQVCSLLTLDDGK